MTGGEGDTIGPILLGVARPVHILTATATVRRLVNMAALAIVESLSGRNIPASPSRTDKIRR